MPNWLLAEGEPPRTGASRCREELRDSLFWYDDQSPGVADELESSVAATVSRVLAWPTAAPIFPNWDREPTVRSRRVVGFPYRVIYYLTDAELVIVAYAHQRRKPRYWEHRLVN